jgi:hypothetical protein
MLGKFDFNQDKNIAEVGFYVFESYKLINLLAGLGEEKTLTSYISERKQDRGSHYIVSVVFISLWLIYFYVVDVGCV